MTHKRNGSTRYLIFLFSLAIFLFTACDPDDSFDSLNSAFGEPAKGPSPDSRFSNGWWTTTSYGRYSPYLNEFEWYLYESKRFNSTNVYRQYANIRKYGIQPYDYPKSFNNEWKITGNQFCERLWNNPYSEWRCESFEFLSSSRVRIGSFVFEKDDSDSFVASGSVKEHLDINQPQSDYAINQAWLKEQSLQLQ